MLRLSRLTAFLCYRQARVLFALLPLFFTMTVMTGDVWADSVSPAQIVANGTASASAVVTSLSSNLPLRRENAESFGIQAGKIFVLLVIFAAVTLLCVVYLKRRIQGSSSRTWMKFVLESKSDPEIETLKLKKRLQLTAKNSLQVVQWGDQEFLLACAEQTITVLGTKSIEKATMKDTMNKTDSAAIQVTQDGAST